MVGVGGKWTCGESSGGTCAEDEKGKGLEVVMVGEGRGLRIGRGRMIMGNDVGGWYMLRMI